MPHHTEKKAGHYARLIGFAVGYVLCQHYWSPMEEGWKDDVVRLAVGMVVAIAFNRAWRWWDGRGNSKKKAEL